MKVVIRKNYPDMSLAASSIMVDRIFKNPHIVLGLATGSTPVGMYQNLITAYREGKVDFSGVASCNLDEYVGLNKSHPQSYHHFMNETLFSKINCRDWFLPMGDASDLNQECKNYDSIIASLGGIDFQILGIGSNGHIGFNEPCSTFCERTHVVDLTDQTISDNAKKYFGGDMSLVPKKALSMGTRQIAKAKEIVIMASGKGKATAVKAAIEGPVSPACQASILQQHDNVTWILDFAAASMLKMKRSYD